jgi:hypothetical protein
VEVRIVNGRWQGGSLSLQSFLEIQYYPVQTQHLFQRLFIAVRRIQFYNKDGDSRFFCNVNNYLTIIGQSYLARQQITFLIGNVNPKLIVGKTYSLF